MGLPLWQPKVESDIPSRPEAKNPAHARSRIRGSSTRDRRAAVNRDRPYASARYGERQTTERRRTLLENMQQQHTAEPAGIEHVSFYNEELIRFPPGTWRNRGANVLPEADVDEQAANRMVSEDLAQAAAAVRRRRDFEEQQQEILNLMARSRERAAAVEAHRLSSSDGDIQEPVAHYGDRDDLGLQLDALRRLERETGGRFGVPPRASERFLRANERIERARASLERTRQQYEAFPTLADTLERGQRLRAQAATFARSANESGRSNAGADVRVDGLGDRDRSLSPEGDNAWDTLLTTVTPDPQPPSIGSSFASVASANVSRATANESSSTSMTGRSTGAADSTQEQPCDSDDEAQPFLIDLSEPDANAPNAYPAAQGGPSYEHVASLGGYLMPGGARTQNRPVRVPLPPLDGDRSGVSAVMAAEPGTFRGPDSGSSSGSGSGGEPATDDLILQLVGGLGGMQHIVRSLVRREDIPNDWWVDAGLSRTLPREDASGDDAANN